MRVPAPTLNPLRLLHESQVRSSKGIVDRTLAGEPRILDAMAERLTATATKSGTVETQDGTGAGFLLLVAFLFTTKHSLVGPFLGQSGVALVGYCCRLTEHFLTVRGCAFTVVPEYCRCLPSPPAHRPTEAKERAGRKKGRTSHMKDTHAQLRQSVADRDSWVPPATGSERAGVRPEGRRRRSRTKTHWGTGAPHDSLVGSSA